MKTTIELFGQLKDITKAKRIGIPAVQDTDEAMKKLYEQFPALRSAKFIIAVNNDIIHANTAITGDCSIALMPAYSGG